jgi:hypothetical protein
VGRAIHKMPPRKIQLRVKMSAILQVALNTTLLVRWGGWTGAEPYEEGEGERREVNSSVSGCWCSTVARVYADSLGSELRGFMVDWMWDERDNN